MESDDDMCSAVSYLKEGLDLNLVQEGVCFETSLIESNLEDIESIYSSCYSDDKDKQNSIRSLDWSNSNSFENLAKKCKAITDDNLVMKQTLNVGKGSVVPPFSSVVVHYSVYLEYSEEPFDSTKLRKQPFRFELGSGSTVEGFNIAVGTMRKKEVSMFLIYPEYAFGVNGIPPRIPKNAICLYLIELIDFQPIGGDTHDYFALPMSERKHASFEVMLKAYKDIANKSKQLFQESKFLAAKRSFTQALTMLENHSLQDEHEERLLQKSLIKVNINLALCNLRLKQSSRTIFHCNEVLREDARNVKALYLKGKALKNSGEFERAKIFLLKAKKIKPGKEILHELEDVERYCSLFQSIINNKSALRALKPEVYDQTSEGKKDESSNEISDFESSNDLSAKLQLFANDEDLMELPLPSGNLTKEQKSEFEKLALEKELLFKELKDDNGNLTIYLRKKHSTCAGSQS